MLQVLTPADDIHHINKHNFKVPFVCGCRDLGEALRRIVEGAAMIRTKGEAGTGNVVEAVRHTRSLTGAIRQLQTLDDDELYVYAKEIRAPVDLVRKTKHLGRSVFPVLWALQCVFIKHLRQLTFCYELPASCLLSVMGRSSHAFRPSCVLFKSVCYANLQGEEATCYQK